MSVSVCRRLMRPRWPARALVALGIVAFSQGCGGNPASPTGDVTTPIDGSYGTLAFRGSVVRRNTGSRYEYAVQLAATFDAAARTNAVSAIHLTAIRFVATRTTTPGASASVLYSDSRSISADFSADRDARQLPSVTFQLDKSIEQQAQHVLVSVTDGRLLWPVPAELKTP